MRRVLLMTFVVMLGASVALAEELPGGRIGIFSDNLGVNCAVTDGAVGLLNVYVVHIMTTGAAACQYKAVKPACFTASFLSDSSPFSVVIGGSQTGVSIGYGSCRVGEVHVQTINFFGSGTTGPCCMYEITCDPLGATDACALGYVDIVDCTQTAAYAKPQVGVINPITDPMDPAYCDCSEIVPTQETNWGKVKALYVE